MRISLMSLIAVVVAGLSGCSDSDDKSGAYGTLTLANSTSRDNLSSIDLNNKVSCKRDANFGYLALDLKNSSGNAQLVVQIKGFESVAREYVCKQATDNTTKGTVGGKFDVCSVYAEVPTSGDSKVSNGYSMFRDEAIKSLDNVFTYAGDCKVTIVQVSPTAKGSVSCTKMVQTKYGGSNRNPIIVTETADVTASFDCALE
jgi:hypothetical protein